MDYGLWSNDEAWSNMQSQLLLTVGVWSLLCGENQPLLRLFVDLAHQQLLRARSKRLRANLHFPRKLIAVWNTSPVPFFFFLLFSPILLAPPCSHMFTVIVAFSDDYARAFAGLVSNPFLYWADVCLNSLWMERENCSLHLFSGHFFSAVNLPVFLSHHLELAHMFGLLLIGTAFFFFFPPLWHL